MKYKFELSESQLQVVRHALFELPYKLTASVIAELAMQLDAQQPKGVQLPSADAEEAVDG